jgi:hypothetical protein
LLSIVKGVTDCSAAHRILNSRFDTQRRGTGEDIDIAFCNPSEVEAIPIKGTTAAIRNPIAGVEVISAIPTPAFRRC